VQEPDEMQNTLGKTGKVDRKRRGLLRAMFGSAVGLGFTALGFASGLWAAATARFMMPNVVTEPPNRFKAGYPADYAPDSVDTRFKERFGVWVVRTASQGKDRIVALRTVCTHLGCITLWQAGQRRFKCPCHGSGVSIEGMHLEGPAPRPLERYAIRTADAGQLEIDKTKTFRQELGQWNDPASYVEV